MNNIPYTISNDGKVETLILTLNGVPRVVDSSHQNFTEIKEGLSTLSVPEMRELLDLKKAIQKQLKRFGNVVVSDDSVEYRGEKVHGLLADRMMQMLSEGYNIAPWALFMENLQQNPAKHAVDELYLWLERSNMPITERGNFLAYKKVKDDYTSYHLNADGSKFHNDIGTLCSMPRNKVDDNRDRTCSTGLHFCSWDYLPSYMGSQGKVLLVEVNPAHVVSIPSDYNNAKGRAEAYLVVGEIPQEECEHAFEGIPSVGFFSSEYITYNDPSPIDYSHIEEDWYDDYEYDEDDEWSTDSYNQGYVEGCRDAYAFKFSNAGEAYEDLNVDYDFEAFYDGYNDAHWTVSRNLSELADAPTEPEPYEDFFDPDYDSWMASLTPFEDAADALREDVADAQDAFNEGVRVATMTMRGEFSTKTSPVMRNSDYWSEYWRGYFSVFK